MSDDDESNNNIKRMIDMNEIKTQVSSPFVAAVEQSRFAAFLHPKNSWYQNYSVQDGFVNETDFKTGASKKVYEVGDEISAMEAVNDPILQEDTRPKFFDNVTKTWSLLDSGACVSCIPKGPNDKMDSSFKLRAVNGQCIPTFGSEVIQIRIGRKQYEIEAIKTDIPQRILGGPQIHESALVETNPKCFFGKGGLSSYLYHKNLDIILNIKKILQ